ncbi:hypothetical protein K488DRAFT_82810 [Vararia minispora EC-137]|uniref:Uncharacterized protein n=1 Tax=Vararia minispora EC-137 TaxID=1314806 RepID=A0ACB8QVU3_9AGAM|nr:hypothetical protein K488DRAFT_82810 [Vararia minispora EC-137]
MDIDLNQPHWPAVLDWLSFHPHIVHLIATNPQEAPAVLEDYLQGGHMPSSRSVESSSVCGFRNAPHLMRQRVIDASIHTISVPVTNSLKMFTSSTLITLLGSKRLATPRLDIEDEKIGSSPALLLRGHEQPYLPSAPGEPGVYLSIRPRINTWPAFEAAFSSQNRYSPSHGENDWQYLGQYELLDAAPLDPVKDIGALPNGTRHKFFRTLADSKGRDDDYAVRLRARIFLRKYRGVTNPTPMMTSKCLKKYSNDHIRQRVKFKTISKAIREGDEKLYAYVMRPVGYNTGILMRLNEIEALNTLAPHSRTPSPIAGPSMSNRRLDLPPPLPILKGERRYPYIIAFPNDQILRQTSVHELRIQTPCRVGHLAIMTTPVKIDEHDLTLVVNNDIGCAEITMDKILLV